TQYRIQEAMRGAAQLKRELESQRDSLGPDAPSELAQRIESAQALEREVRTLNRTASQISGAYNGQGVRQGSLYPPTTTHRDLMTRVEARLQSVIDRLQGGD
ncbi:MAG: hypothetical protein JSW51_02545, partial [Gemmatimonadota bacterium]